ncbi:MAG: type II 3-dehydroquinate dehydratase [Phycisphaerales bacterium]|nr:type II 3-dehydroquinate dehydratase [Phycisphaerales bacterium]
MQVKSLLILNGPGLDDLRRLDSSFDKDLTLDRIESACGELCAHYGIDMTFREGNVVTELFDWIAKDAAEYDALIINPIGYYSYEAYETFEQYRSAIKTLAHLEKPVVEVHLTNFFRHGADLIEPLREPDAQIGFICGLGLHSYLLAIESIAQRYLPQGRAS